MIFTRNRPGFLSEIFEGSYQKSSWNFIINVLESIQDSYQFSLGCSLEPYQDQGGFAEELSQYKRKLKNKAMIFQNQKEELCY